MTQPLDPERGPAGGVTPGVLMLDDDLVTRGWNSAFGEFLQPGAADPRDAASLQDILKHSRFCDGEQEALLDMARQCVATRMEGHVQLGPLAAHISLLAAGLWVISLGARSGDSPGRSNGLMQRGEFLDRLQQVAGKPPGWAVLLLDLDRFKVVNDTYNHALGDALLRTVAARLCGAVRGDDVAARLGGNEFAVLQKVSSPAEAEALANRLVDLISRPYLLHGQVVNIGVSLGISQAPKHGTDAASLMRRADLALAAAKAAGRGTWRHFAPEQQLHTEARRKLEGDLRRALPLRQLALYYQPQHDAVSGRLVGFEVLLRWRHPERGLLSPIDFIPLAEESGLIGPIGTWVLREACAEAARWPLPLTVAVNVAPRQVEDGRLEEAVSAALSATGLPAQRLEIEVTETALLHNTETTRGTLNALREMGVQISMDDFGTGYSSLTQLRAFPFGRIKIDRSFVSGLSGDGTGTAIVRAVAALGAELGMRTTAEGVETAEQLEAMRVLGCTDVQGYLLGRPVPQSEVAAVIARDMETS
ncbi:putative bifunctional diguanylate cyclase/phosphodiesterase [Roseomonas sp. BN140053]|uniref:putative bifunctional diguanylate cyclase/phosphodiesterase n=1 Tax=Roseomonas sp. BN140053 TaxID=3391898 RepID=UPI0039EC343C